jgi:hypothetical protein
MGSKSRQKGKRSEREVTALARQYGLTATRTWESAQSPDPAARACDVEIAGQPYQVKIQRDGFGTLYRELEGVHGFLFRHDRGECLVLLKASGYFRLLSRQRENTP